MDFTFCFDIFIIYLIHRKTKFFRICCRKFFTLLYFIFSPCSTTLQAAANGSIKHASSSETLSGTTYKFCIGNVINSAKDPFLLWIPRHFRFEQWFLFKTKLCWLMQIGHFEQGMFISPTTLFLTKFWLSGLLLYT